MVPVLLIVLLLVFRSVIAAAIPIIIGGSVVAATRGVVSLSLGAVDIESFALGVVGMMGLALGVDYSLLVVSRFREELRSHKDVSTALQVTVESTGRAILPAGAGLIFAMLIAMQVFPDSLVVSVGFVVIVVSLLSVISAALVVPAMLALVAHHLWSLPREAWRWSDVALASSDIKATTPRIDDSARALGVCRLGIHAGYRGGQCCSAAGE